MTQPTTRELNEARAALLALADAKVPYLAKAYREAIEGIRDLMTLSQLIQSIENGDYYAVQRAFGYDAVQKQLLGFKDALTNVYAAHGIKVAAQSGGKVYFNQVNPRLVSLVNEWTNTLIKQEAQAVVEQVTRTIGGSVLKGQGPRATARLFRENIGLTSQQEQYLANYEQELRNGSAKALQRALRDKRQDAGLRKAIEQNKPLSEEEITKRVTRYRERMLKYRSETIARTESLRLLNMSNQHLYENAIEEGAIRPNDYRRFWVSSKDSRTRDAHLHLPRMNPNGVAMNEPFKSELGAIMYPHDPNARASNTVNCRCTLIYKLQAEAFMR